MKKFSKKLFCLMLVAIMVATAIPFGAFADGTDVNDQDEGLTNVQDGAGTPDVNAVGDTYTVNVIGAVTASGTTPDPIDETTNTADALTKAKISGMDIHDAHTGTGYLVDGDKEYNRGTKTLTIKVKADAHNYGPTGVTSATQHELKCDVKGCTAEAKWENHSDKEKKSETVINEATCKDVGMKQITYNCGAVKNEEIPQTTDHKFVDGVCSVCGAKQEGYVPEYKVIVRKSGSATEFLADGATVKLTDTELAALSGFSGANTLLGKVKDTNSDYAYYYNNLTNAKFVNLKVEKPTKRILIDTTLEKESAVEEKIEVIFDNGRVGSITKEVGTWYFATSNLGYDDTWGTEQAKLKIYSADGTRTVTWGSKDENTAYVRQTDYKVEVMGINRKVTIYYMKSSTANPTTTDAYATKYYEANTQLGELPALPTGYTAWYVDGVKLTPNTVYSWETKSVYAYPGKGDGNGRVHLFIYNKNNELLKNVDVTEAVQDNGLISRSSLVSTIEYQVGRKNLTLSGLYTESGWAYYLNNKNSTAKAQASVDVGKDGERQGTQNLYVVLTNVSGGSNADTSNPKTGDTAMIGTAAIVMALAAVGMGTAFYMKKKELF